MKIPDWIVIDTSKGDGEFLCKRCGDHRKPHLPAAIMDFIKQSEAFTESHKYCEKK